MFSVAVALWWAPAVTLTVAGPKFGEVHGVAADVGPQAKNVTAPVGDPCFAFPTSVTVSTSPLPTATVGLLSDDFIFGVGM